MTQEQIQQINYNLYKIMQEPLLRQAVKRNSRINEFGERVLIKREQWSHNIKKDRPCYVCKEVHPKEEMHRDEYHSQRIENGKWRKVKNTIYRCDKCQANYRPRKEYISGR